jgi:hypothetical protein
MAEIPKAPGELNRGVSQTPRGPALTLAAARHHENLEAPKKSPASFGETGLLELTKADDRGGFEEGGGRTSGTRQHNFVSRSGDQKL